MDLPRSNTDALPCKDVSRSPFKPPNTSDDHSAHHVMETLSQAVSSNPSFSPLFRLLDDFERCSHLIGHNRNHHSGHLRPSFDIRDLADAYELDGELAGVQKKDVTIEVTDAKTLVIRGSVDRPYTSGRTLEQSAAPTDVGAAAAPAGDAQDPNYWLRERSVGEFSRSFSFPESISHDGITAKLEDGILAIRVPKTKQRGKRVDIA